MVKNLERNVQYVVKAFGDYQTLSFSGLIKRTKRVPWKNYNLEPLSKQEAINAIREAEKKGLIKRIQEPVGKHYKFPINVSYIKL